MIKSPAVIIYNSSGNELSVIDGYSINASTPGLMIAGSDGNNARLLKLDSDGTVNITGTIIANIGTTGGLALDTTLSKLTIAQSTALGSNTNILIGGSVTTSSPSYTNGNINPLSLTTSGALRIDGSAVTQPISGSITANIGTSGSLALDATVLAQSIIDNAGFTDGTTRILPSGFIFDEVAGTSLTENDAAAARIDSKRAQICVLEDASTRGTRITIKAASTAAVAGDTALVVAISPNNTINTKEVRSSTGTTTTVASSASSVTLLASNTNRLGATIYNDSSTANLFVKLGATASITSFTTRILPNGYYEVPFGYIGIIDGIWNTASGDARITELEL